MGIFTRVANVPLTTERLDAWLGQILCFVAAVVLLVIAVRKLCSLQLAEGQFLIGLLATIACSLLLVVLGLLLPISVAVRKGGQR